MFARRSSLFVLAWVSLLQLGCAADPPPYKLETIQGTVVSYQKETLTIQPSDSKAKPVALKVTGTSKFAIAGTQTRDKQIYMTQRDVEAKALEEKQSITVIYANIKPDKSDKNEKAERVLLSAVIGPS